MLFGARAHKRLSSRQESRVTRREMVVCASWDAAGVARNAKARRASGQEERCNWAQAHARLQPNCKTGLLVEAFDF